MHTFHDEKLGAIAVKRHWNAKRITVRIISGHVVATAPPWAQPSDVQHVIEQNREEIARMLHKARQDNRSDGTVVDNEWLSVTLESREGAGTRIVKNAASYKIILPPDCGMRLTDAAITACLRNRASETLPALLSALAKRHGFTYASVGINSSKTRWGSCSAKGKINLSASLMLLPRHLVEFVLLHELCHTVHMDHGKGFKELLDKCCSGQRQKLADELRKHTARL